MELQAFQNPKCTLKVEAANVPFTADFPDVDPSGGAAEIEFSFDNIGLASRSGSPVTVTIVNKVESY